MSIQLNLDNVLTWVKANQLILGLLGSALVITMPEKLPALREFPEWFWEWTRDASKTFLNFRHSGTPISDTTHLQQQTLLVKPVAKLLDPSVTTNKKEEIPQLLNG